MSFRPQTRIACALVALVAGFATVWLTREPSQAASPPVEPGAAPTGLREPSRRFPAEAEPQEASGSDAESPACDPQREEMLDYGVRAARAEILTRYGRPPASLQPPSQAEIDVAFPDALASLVTCTPEPCRLTVATRTRIEGFQSLPEEWGYPHGLVSGGTIEGAYVLDFAFVADALTPLESKFVRNAWSFDHVAFEEMLLPQLEDGDHE